MSRCNRRILGVVGQAFQPDVSLERLTYERVCCQRGVGRQDNLRDVLGQRSSTGAASSYDVHIWTLQAQSLYRIRAVCDQASGESHN